VKGGESYRRSSGYGIPIDEDHVNVWRQSSVPVAGIIYDPDDKKLRWCNISDYLRNISESLPSFIPVDATRILNQESLESDFRKCFQSYHRQMVAGPALLQLTSNDESARTVALLDCFALGRSDARLLILLRYLLGMFKDDNLRLAIRILAHATPHPDIFWHKGNWIPETVCAEVKAHLRLSEDEIAYLMKAIPSEDWQRGGSGQDLYSILCVDPSIEKKMGEVAIRAIEQGCEELAFYAMYLMIYWAKKDGLAMYEGFLRINHKFRDLELSGELELLLKEYGYVTLFE
jgi:hypothetical protein